MKGFIAQRELFLFFFSEQIRAHLAAEFQAPEVHMQTYQKYSSWVTRKVLVLSALCFVTVSVVSPSVLRSFHLSFHCLLVL